jgi:hypothetical protein
MSNCILAPFVIAYGLTHCYTAYNVYWMGRIQQFQHGCSSLPHPTFRDSPSRQDAALSLTPRAGSNSIDFDFSKKVCRREDGVDLTVRELQRNRTTLEPFSLELWRTLVSFSFVMFNTLIYTLVSPFYGR